MWSKYLTILMDTDTFDQEVSIQVKEYPFSFDNHFTYAAAMVCFMELIKFQMKEMVNTLKTEDHTLVNDKIVWLLDKYRNVNKLDLKDKNLPRDFFQLIAPSKDHHRK